MTKKTDHLELGQYIPLHYHYHMLNETARMQGFKEAIDLVVKPNDVVLELGGGTAVQSYFAAQKAKKVYCVERNPELIDAARSILNKNPNGDKVELVLADAMSYLPPEPVDVVICEMLHTGLLREKQLPIIAEFKKRYLEKFDGPLPIFIPEACIQAIQPVQQDFNFEGYYAPAIMFQDPTGAQARTTDLSNPAVFQLFSYHEDFSQTCECDGLIQIEQDGQLNAIRMITKNILAINVNAEASIEWHTQHIVVPLPQSVEVKKGDHLSVSFSYQGGDALTDWTDSLNVAVVYRASEEENQASKMAETA